MILNQVFTGRIFFSEELGLVFEIREKDKNYVDKLFLEKGIFFEIIGNTTTEKELLIKYNGEIVWMKMMMLDMNGKTSYMLEMKQARKICIEQEIKNCYQMGSLKYVLPKDIFSNLTYYLKPFNNNIFNKPRVAILRSIKVMVIERWHIVLWR